MNEGTATALERLGEATRLFSLPDIYFKLKSVLDDPDFAMGDVADVMASDPGMTARLLKLVNSPFFGIEARIDTVPRAVNMLGTQQIHDLVLATSVTEAFAGISTDIMDMGRFWRQSVFCAGVARLIAQHCCVLDSERLFVAGLLRDIGHLVLYDQLPDPSAQALQLARESGRALHEIERELLGCDYAQVGGLLLRRWGLPAGLRDSVENQIDPAGSREHLLETSIVHLSGCLTDAEVATPEELPEVLNVDAIAWQLTGLTPDSCGLLYQQALDKTDEMTRALIPQHRTASR